jgi:hypothetical protein
MLEVHRSEPTVNSIDQPGARMRRPQVIGAREVGSKAIDGIAD